MRDELNTLTEALRQVAFDAGWALLHQPDSETLERCIHRYDELCTRLHALVPTLACGCRRLPKDASPGQIRLAARDAARAVFNILTSSCSINRWAA